MSPQCMAPWCFDNHEQFSEWYRLTAISCEAATVCDDCTPEFKARMKSEQRCDDYKWQALEFTARSGMPRIRELKEPQNG